MRSYRQYQATDLTSLSLLFISRIGVMIRDGRTCPYGKHGFLFFIQSNRCILPAALFLHRQALGARISLTLQACSSSSHVLSNISKEWVVYFHASDVDRTSNLKMYRKRRPRCILGKYFSSVQHTGSGRFQGLFSDSDYYSG